VVQLLLENGPDVIAEANSRETVLHWAARMGHKEVVQPLLEHKGRNRHGGSKIY
jgi:ankyrin repeat protein